MYEDLKNEYVKEIATQSEQLELIKSENHELKFRNNNYKMKITICNGSNGKESNKNSIIMSLEDQIVDLNHCNFKLNEDNKALCASFKNLDQKYYEAKLTIQELNENLKKVENESNNKRHIN